ncbi:glycosyltransferase [Fluviicola chungangensis]|uniref:Glycosyltransferase n=1 Tax=Fluviicola chungangensis TaxID=2597671 RepID=A0A556MQ47_9FLAO|nr:glycosyltransferase [Fluviicola chungangensis]TSJ42063.1 glycosyltransferase [Fluviicola chungangensis]
MKHPINFSRFAQPLFPNHHADSGVRLAKLEVPVVLLITSYPPRECGIATYSQDLLEALKQQFDQSFEVQVCALEDGFTDHQYPKEVTYTLQTGIPIEYAALANKINNNDRIGLIVIQHEFGLFRIDDENTFLKFIQFLKKPVVTVFHTVLPNPNGKRKTHVRNIGLFSDSIIVMTNHAAEILKNEYAIPAKKISLIPHGTHLVPHLDKEQLKQKFGLQRKTILSTFGLLSSGKGIETTLEALPQIVSRDPGIVFLIIGKTHPGVIASEGEAYRESLKAKVKNLKLENHVLFVNKYLSLKELLEYLQLTDIYLFTSRDPNQSVSGTFSYAMSCGCPIISTPIPHAKEFLNEETGIIVDFSKPDQLAHAIEQLLENESLRERFTSNGLERIAPTAWENSSIAHARLFQRLTSGKIELHYALPEINLAHFSKLTDRFGMIQFSKINQPDRDSGYTLDDNARAMIARCMYYETTLDGASLVAIQTYLKFISFCQQPGGEFLNYVDQDQLFSNQNFETNLSDSNGRAIWALGYLISKQHILPEQFGIMAKSILEKALKTVENMHSPRAIAFAIKGLYFSNLEEQSPRIKSCIKLLADRLIGIYRSESEENWPWFESYLTYANSILPEALLCAWKETGDQFYKIVAKKSFDFLLSLTFSKTGIKLISNKSWLHKGHKPEEFGEQPIDVAYTILALDHFHETFGNEGYLKKSELAFSWFLGNNHLSRIIYNPGTGGCYDGLEREHINLNQGAESTISYLIARMTIEKQHNTRMIQPKKIHMISVEKSYNE